MATNPMQRKARNAFLGGMLLMLVIALIVGAGIYFVTTTKNKKVEEEKGEEVVAYVLSQDIESGKEITANLLTPITVYSAMIPSNYVSNINLSQFELQDDKGNILYTNKDGQMYIKENDKNIIIKIDEKGNYYKGNETSKEYVEFTQVPFVAKINMKANSLLTLDSITKADQQVTNDVRLIQYNMLTLPSTIAIGDFVDIRLTLPSGQDFVVLSKEEVIDLQGDTVSFYLTQDQILMMNSAIVEAYIIKASNLYAIQYVEPGLQKAASQTYTPTDAVRKLIEIDSNIVTAARESLLERFDDGIRGYINADKNNYYDSQIENVETGIKEQIEKAKQSRQEYLTGLQSTTTN